jgi:TRAP-type C4-dicarboxylate transport system permease small subunit
MDRILKFKSWQIFIPCLIAFGAVALAAELHSIGYYICCIIGGIIYWGSLFVWLYIAGIAFINKIPTNTKKNEKLFKQLFVLAFFAICLFVVSLVIMESNRNEFLSILFISSGVSIFIIYLIITKMVARAITIWEYNGNVSFKYYSLNYFLVIYFYPIGVWFIQPNVNKMTNGELGSKKIHPSIEDRENYCCSACGAVVELGCTKCPKCGEVFEDN